MKKNILLVEDEALIALSTKKILEKNNNIVTHAKSGEEAYRLAVELNYDIILMDIDLGRGMDGTETAKKILKEKNVPIVFVSSHTEEEVINKTKGITSYGYVFKSSGEYFLIASIDMAIKLHSARTETEEVLRIMNKTSANLPGMIYQFFMNDSDAECSFPIASEKIWEIYEVTPDEVRLDASKVYERIHSDDLQKVVNSIQYSHDSLTTWSCEYRVILPTQGEKWVKGVANPEKKKDGVLWNGFIYDISQEKHKDLQLEKFSNALEQSPAGIVITDTNGNIEYANKKMQNLTEYKKEELVGKNPKILQSGKQSKKFYENLWNTITSGKKWEGEMINKKKSGDHYWEQASISPVFDDSGNIINFIGIKQDITDIKTKEKEREIFLREVHHRMKNNFSAVESLINLQMNTTSNEEAKNVLIDAKGRIQSMRLVYDKLIQTEEFKEEVCVKEYFEEFTEAIMKVFKNGTNVTLEKNIDSFVLSPKKIFSIGVVVNEFVTNSMKYAFRGDEFGKIILALKKNNNKANIELRDNGKGTEQKNQGKESFGMLLMNTMLQQLDADYDMYNDNGFVLTAEFNID